LTVACSLEIHTEYIVAFILQEWLGKHAALLHYMYIA